MKLSILSSALMSLALPGLALATNGMNPIAFGARSAGMGGADIAVARSSQAMNTNPAGLTRQGNRLDVDLSLLMPSLTMNDSAMTPGGVMDLNKGLESESSMFPLVSIGGTWQAMPDLTVGLGFLVQGGMGSDFQGLNTMTDPAPGVPNDPMSGDPADMPVPGQYEANSQVAYMKFTPTVAYRFKDLGGMMDLSLGVAANVGIAQMKFTHTGFQFPDGDNDGMYASTGVDFDSDYVVGFALRLGLLAEFLDGDLAFGASYQSQAKLPFEGDMKISTGQGDLDYDSEIEFGWPQEIGVGLAGKPIKGLLLAIDARWVNWSETMGLLNLEGDATGPTPPGYEKMTLPFKMDWSDQIVIAVGAEYEVTDWMQVRVGYNYGKSPVDGVGQSPLFPAVTEQHYTAGLGFRLMEGLYLDTAIEIAPEVVVAATEGNQMLVDPDTGNPNGYAFDVGMSQITAHMGLGYVF